MISKKSLVAVLDKSIILTITAPNDNANQDPVQCAPPPTVRQAVGEVQSLELHQYKSAMVLSTILIKNKVFLHYKMVFDEILNHNVYLFVLTLT